MQDTKSLKPKANSRLSETGFTLIELMISTGIGTVVALGVSTLFIFALEQFSVLVNQNNVEEELLWASYHLKSTLSQAVSIKPASATGDQAGPANAISTGVGVQFDRYGAFADQYDSTAPAFVAAPGAAQVDLVAAFPRENAFATNQAAGSPALNGSTLFTTAIYFTRPEQMTPGRIYIDVGNPTDGNFQAVQPNTQSIFYEGFTEFQVIPAQTEDFPDPGGADISGTALSMRSTGIRLVARYFKRANRAAWMYCPVADLAACPNISVYGDVETIVNIAFRNNVLVRDCGDMPTGCPAEGSSAVPTDAAGQYRERLLGGVYFYKMAVPPIRR